MDLETIAKTIATKVAEELDGKLPDGIGQTAAGETLKLLGMVFTEVGTQLSGAQNSDADG